MKQFFNFACEEIPSMILRSCQRNVGSPGEFSENDSTLFNSLIEGKNVGVLKIGESYYLSDDILLVKDQFICMNYGCVTYRVYAGIVQNPQ